MTQRGEERRIGYEEGRLTQAVETLTKEVSSLKTEVETISRQMNRGKGVVAGMLIAAGGIGAGVSSALHKAFGNG